MSNREIYRLLLDKDEIDILHKVAKIAGAHWFRIADRTLDGEQKKPVKSRFMYDRVFDVFEGHCIEARYGIAKLDLQLSDGFLEKFTEDEKRKYGGVLYKFHIKSKNSIADEIGIFRGKGHSRRCFRWSCMDELATALLNDKAVELWNVEGHPKRVVSFYTTEHLETMDEFRSNKDKEGLTEAEFKRISLVFRDCINMTNQN